jgi:beta-galactosidase
MRRLSFSSLGRQLRRFPFLLIALTACAAEPGKFQPPASPRSTWNFNPGWKFLRQDAPGAEQPDFDDSAWSPVSTPHTWNDVDTYRAFIGHSGGERTPEFYAGVGWYRKHFKLPASAKDGKVFLEFEGLKQAGRFFVNGQPAGRIENGITACGLDLTDLVKFGDEDNVLAVKVDNSDRYVEEATGVGFQWMGRAFNPNFGGINHNVWLHLTGRIYQTLPLFNNLQTTGADVYANHFDIKDRTADVHVEAQVRNESGDFAAIALSTVIVDADGIERARFESEKSDLVNGQSETFTTSGPLAAAHFWDVNDPYLYDVYSILSVGDRVVDVSKIRTGFRKIEFKGGAGTGGVWLNDRFLWLTGFAQRSVNDWAGLGQAYPDWMHDWNAQLVRAFHSNYLRWMHIAPGAADVRACDKAGIVEICPAGDKEGDPVNDKRLTPEVAARQWEQRAEVMRATLISYRNSPSIFAWEAGNQVITPPHMQQMVALRKEWDPSSGRLMGVRHGDDNAAAAAITSIAEYYLVMIGQAPQTDRLTGDVIFRGYSAPRRDRAPLIETEDFRDEAPRGIWDDSSPPHFGFRPKGQPGRDGDTWHWNSETFALAATTRYHAYMLNRIDNHDPAHSKWSGYASIYFSDSNADGRQEASEVLRVSGKVDAVRLPKEIYYVTRVMQNEQPDLHIIGHWTYPAGTKKAVYVAANHCDAVELSVNGESKGVVKQPFVFVDDYTGVGRKNVGETGGDTGYIYAFPDIAFTPGVLKAVAMKDGQVVAQEEIKTAGEAAAIKLTPHTGPGGLQASGSDVAFFDFEVVDAQGNRCPTDEGRVDFAVTGPAVWRGGLNSAKLNSTNNLYLDTECGINRVAIRSTLTPGTITLTATRGGLAPATVKVEARAMKIIAGLAPVESPEPAVPAAANADHP